MEEWARQLTESALEQAMGFLAEPDTNEPGDRQFLDKAFSNIHDRLQVLRTVLVARGNPVSPELLLFPNELNQLKPGSTFFFAHALATAPTLKRLSCGACFSAAACSRGEPFPRCSARCCRRWRRTPPPTRAFSCTTFSGGSCRRTSNISLPASLRNPWRTATQNLGLLSWVLLSLAAAIVMTMGFLNNMETLSLLQEKNRLSIKFEGQLEAGCRPPWSA
jgi:type VI secretion system protein ImpL